jgi:hypothetical protein
MPPTGRTATLARATAASLIATFSADPEAIAILKQARAAATNRTEMGNLDLALCQAYVKAKRWNDLLTTARSLETNLPASDKWAVYALKARTGLQQWAEIEQEARAELRRAPQFPRPMRAAAIAMIQAGKLDAAKEYAAKLHTLPFASAEDRRVEAWFAILSGKADPTLVAKLEGDRHPDRLESETDYQIGLLQAAAGLPEDAQRSLRSALELEAWSGLDARPWILQAKIQELYGNAASAAAAYAEAKKRVVAGEASEWVARLAK